MRLVPVCDVFVPSEITAVDGVPISRGCTGMVEMVF